MTDDLHHLVAAAITRYDQDLDVTAAAGQPLTFAELTALAATLPPPPRRVLEVGPGVLTALRLASPTPTREPCSLDALTGIPIHETNDLAPGAWRLLENDEVIQEGTL